MNLAPLYANRPSIRFRETLSIVAIAAVAWFSFEIGVLRPADNWLYDLFVRSTSTRIEHEHEHDVVLVYADRDESLADPTRLEEVIHRLLGLGAKCVGTSFEWDLPSSGNALSGKPVLLGPDEVVSSEILASERGVYRWHVGLIPQADKSSPGSASLESALASLAAKQGDALPRSDNGLPIGNFRIRFRGGTSQYSSRDGWRRPRRYIDPRAHLRQVNHHWLVSRS